MSKKRMLLLGLICVIALVTAVLPLTRQTASLIDHERTLFDIIFSPEQVTLGDLDLRPQQPLLISPFTEINYSIGDDFFFVQGQLGDEVWSGVSEYGFTWHAFHNHYRGYQLIGVRDSRIVAYYSRIPVQNRDLSLMLTENSTDIEKRYGQSLERITKGRATYYYDDEDIGLYQVGSLLIRAFYNDFEDEAIAAILVMAYDEELNLRGYYAQPSEDLKQTFNWQMEDLINVERLKYGASVLEHKDSIANIANEHSKDMAINKFFSHIGSDGSTLGQRYRRSDEGFQKVGENIAQGQYSAIYAHHQLMNSKGHRDNLRDGQYRYIGAAVTFNELKVPSFVQNFLAK